MNITMILNRSRLLLTFAAFLMMSPSETRAHWDTLDGPVITDARAALASGDVTPVLKWVRSEDEREIREVFEKTMAVRTLNDAVRELADRFFFETLVRVHRAGEGAPYTGLKPAGSVDHAVMLADQALDVGSAECAACGEGECHLGRTANFLILAIYVHNFPEGMAIAVALQPTSAALL